jgi:uncharacterized protein (TIGR02271 family)
MTGETSEYTGREIVDMVEGIDLYTTNDEKVGHIAEVSTDYIVVEEGDMFDRAMFIPRSAVQESGDDRWTVQGDVWQYATDQRPGGSDQSADVGTSRQTDVGGDTERIQVHEEDLQARKVAREAGEVVVNKEVVEEVKTVDVPVMREEVRVERRPVTDGDQTADASDAFTGDTIRVPVMEEDVEVRKVPRAVEEVEISKVRTQDTKHVQDTVRKEQLDIDDASGRTTEDRV